MRSILRASGVVGALLAAMACVASCTSCDSVSIHVFDDDLRVWVQRGDYSLAVHSDGEVTFRDDETDVATLAPGAKFELDETIDGVEHEYEVTSDRLGALTRRYSRDGVESAFDESAKSWLAAALLRAFREGGFDAEARIQRLLAKGGADAALAETERVHSDWARSTYLIGLFGARELDAARFERALTAAREIDSDYELHRVLRGALGNRGCDGAGLARVLETGAKLDSDYEAAELAIETADRASADAGARTVWLALVGSLDSDWEARRSLEAGLASAGCDASFARELVDVGARNVDSDWELRNVLEASAPRASDPDVASAYLAATRELDSDFERRNALTKLLASVHLDAPRLGLVLDSVAGMDSDFEQRQVLVALAPSVATDPELSRRYRDVARELSDFERGKALTALDDALRQ
jgi:hypothetical protein